MTKLSNLEGALQKLSTAWKLVDSRELWKTRKQAEAWLRFVLSPEALRQQYSGEVEAIKIHALKIVEQARHKLATACFNVVDLGCGDGKKGIDFTLKALKATTCVRYIPVDQNRLFVRHAAEQALKHGLEAVSTSPTDFFTSDYSQYRTESFPSNIYLMLGNLYYQTAEISGLFQRILAEKDFAVLGTELMPANVNQMMERYRTNAQVEGWFFRSAERLGFGKRDIVFNPGFTYSSMRVDWGYDVLNVPRLLANEVPMQKGDRLVLAYSLRPTPDELESWLGHHFNLRLYFSSDKSAALACCTKKQE